ncbi:MAG: SufBD protein [Lawsonibacter sp.]|nr:SufBD protein [Lawsonibacter sp.]
MAHIEDLVAQLTVKRPTDGCAAMKELQTIGETSDAVYSYMARLIGMLDSDNSYVRTRGLLLIVANARWDTDSLIDENINQILSHITDPKPITARQFIQSLPALATAKPNLRADILAALRKTNTLRYPLSMRPLVDGDISKAILIINRGESE